MIAAERRRGIEQVLAVLHIQYGVSGIGRFVSRRKANDHAVRSLEIARRRIAGGALACPTVKCTIPFQFQPKCAETTSSGTARRFTAIWNCSRSATPGFPSWCSRPPADASYEYEDRGMVARCAPKIERGELQVICVDSVDQESWYNRWAIPADRLHRQNAFDAYLVLEVAPFVRNRTSWDRRWAPPAAALAAITPSTSRCAIRTW